MDKKHLVNLCSRTWSITALALMARGVSGRVSPLAAEAGCGRTAMSVSVEHLIDLGLLERNPGHGHPLRPEFRLTLMGLHIAEWALELGSFAESESDKALMRSKWTLPLIDCLHQERRYSDLRRELVPVTDRALSNCLSKLTEHRWVNRLVSVDTVPPMVRYHSFRVGQKVHDHLQLLAKVA
jgi:DNA-binding HxlR family transcriptional regulator